MSHNEEKKICGIVMPISTLDGCSEGHWSDVLEIIREGRAKSGAPLNFTLGLLMITHHRHLKPDDKSTWRHVNGNI